MLNEKFIATLKKTEDGAVIVPFVDDKTNEVFGTVCFDPTDEELPKRLKILGKNVENAAKLLSTISVAAFRVDGTVSKRYPGSVVAMKKAEKILKEGLDACFGKGTYKALFSKRRPYAKVKGEFFLTIVVRAFRENIFITEER